MSDVKQSLQIPPETTLAWAKGEREKGKMIQVWSCHPNLCGDGVTHYFTTLSQLGLGGQEPPSNDIELPGDPKVRITGWTVTPTNGDDQFGWDLKTDVAEYHVNIS